MKKIIYLLVSALLFVSCAKEEFTQISMEELAQRLQTESDYILLDVRTPEEFSTGHIPGAICIPNESIGKQEITVLPNKKQRIYIYCRSGRRSQTASKKMQQQGLKVYDMKGGFNAWKAAGMPVEK